MASETKGHTSNFISFLINFNWLHVAVIQPRSGVTGNSNMSRIFSKALTFLCLEVPLPKSPYSGSAPESSCLPHTMQFTIETLVKLKTRVSEQCHTLKACQPASKKVISKETLSCFIHLSDTSGLPRVMHPEGRGTQIRNSLSAGM